MLKQQAPVAWRNKDRRKTWSGASILATILFFVACAFLTTTASAQGKPNSVRAVGAIEIDSGEIEAPVGLAFSTRAKEFLVLEKTGGRGSQSRGIKRLDDAQGVTGRFALPAAIDDPINMAFDESNARLFFLHPRSNKLIQIGAGADGVPRPDAFSEVDIEQLGVTDPQGMAVDPVTGDLFILDAAWPEIVRVIPDPIRGFEWPRVSAIGLDRHGFEASALRGLALDPQSGHLHVLSPREQRLYEVKDTGVLVANRDISDLGLRDPQGLVFAPSRDRTDEPSVMHLFVADSGNEPGGADQGGAGQITEISLTATAGSVTRIE